MWELFSLSRELKVRPSELLAIDDPLTAYCLDECVVTWGLFVRNELEKVGQKLSSKEKAIMAQRQAKLEALLGNPKTDAAPKRFAVPVATR